MVVALALAGTACGGDGGSPAERADADAPTTTVAGDAGPTEAPGSTAPTTPPLTRPDWLGTRVIPDGAGPQPTPPELDPRALPTVDALPPPADGAFHAAIAAVPPDVAARSTWQPDCPVALEDLRYVTVSFRGFDGLAHTGELLVHADAADAMVAAFERLFAVGYPIEDMRISTLAELDAPNTGDGNVTTAFVCRPTRGRSSWSQHAYGRAVDVNPFQNPYVRDGTDLIPGFATSYLDRGNVRPGMIVAGDGTVSAFGDVGWQWGGAWSNPVDYMHFSANGR